MSFYSTLHGEIEYYSRTQFNEILQILEDGEWVKDFCFIDECGDPYNESDEPDIDWDAMFITIPLGFYRNLSRVDFFPSSAKGVLVGTSTDGCFDGWKIKDGKEEHFDLDEWAKENITEPRPTKEGYDSEDDYWEDFCAWQGEVEAAFHD